MPGKPASPSLIHNRDFMLLWTGQAVSVLGSRISSIAFPLLVLAMTGSPAKAGLVGFAGTIPYLVFQLPAGGFIDRWNRKRTMIVCDTGRALALASIPVALWLDKVTMTQLAAVAFVEGTLFVFFQLAEQSALPHVVPHEQIPAAIAQNEARTRGATLAGQPIGGLLFAIDRAVPFVADAVSYAVSIVTLLFVRADLQEERTAPNEPLHREIAEGVRWLWRQPFLRACAFLIAGSNFMFQALVLVVIVLAKEQGASAATVGLILGFLGGGGLLGAIVAPWAQRRFRAKTVIIGSNWLWAALVPLMAVVAPPILLGPIFALMALVGPAFNVVLGTYELVLTPDRLRGRAQSVVLLLAWGSIPFGSLAAGFLLQWLGGRAAAFLLAGFMVAIAIAATVSPSIRHVAPLEELQANS